jgi:hypothetical protein
MLTPGDEESLLKDIKEGVQHALYLGKQRDRFSEEEIRLDKIRLNKLQYIINEDRDLGITFGWFKYGPAPEDVTTGGVDLKARSEDDIEFLDESRLPSEDFLSTEEFAWYFLKELDDEFVEIVTAENTKVYLEDFYRKYAPQDRSAAKFTDLYITSIRLQQTLDEIGGGREWHEHSTEYYYEVDELFVPVIEELSKHESLEDTVEPLEGYRRELTSILAEADAKEELTVAQQAFISSGVIAKFYNTFWDFVAQEISLQTMRGDNVDELQPDVEANATKYREGAWESELKAIRSRRSSVGLEPDLDDIEELGSEGNGEEDTQDLDSELISQISEMGAEVISE